MEVIVLNQNSIALPPQGGAVKATDQSCAEFNPKYYRKGVLYKLYMWGCIATGAGLILFLPVFIGCLLSLWSWWWLVVPAYPILVSQVCLMGITKYLKKASLEDKQWHGFG